MKKEGRKSKVRFISINKSGDIILSKKGLSEIVATLIIILVTLVAVGIIWAVISNVINSGTQQIALNQYNVDLQITKAQVSPDNTSLLVYVKNAGQGDFTGMDFVFNNRTSSQVIRVNSTIVPLQEKSFSFTFSDINITNLQTISVAPFTKINSGPGTVGATTSTFDISKIVAAVVTGGPLFQKETSFEKGGFSGVQLISYSVSSGSNGLPVYPEFKNATVDPLDVSPGQNQTYITVVYSPYNVTNVTSFTELDHSNLSLTFIKIADNNAGTSVWSVNWTANDTHQTTYLTWITAVDSAGNKNKLSLGWADTVDCAGLIPMTATGPYVITQSCTLTTNEVAGLSSGTLTIGSATGPVTVTLNSGTNLLTAGGFSFYNSSSSLQLVQTGTLPSIHPSGYLYYYDTDGDGFANNATMVYSTTALGAGYTLATNILATSDCDNNFYSTTLGGCGLYNGVHSESQCTSAGGTFYTNGLSAPKTIGDCKFSGSSCLGGWTANGDTATSANTFLGVVSLSNPFAKTISGPLNLACACTSCTTGSHAFPGSGQETCTYLNCNPTNTCPAPSPSSGTCYATISYVGCY